VDFSLQDSGFLIANFCSFILQQTRVWSVLERTMDIFSSLAILYAAFGGSVAE
jgi:hypothetical protein